MISFSALCIRKPHDCEKASKREKNPEIVRFRGFEAMISFLASLYGWDIGIRILASRRRQVTSALTCHRQVIHYRARSNSYSQKKRAPKRCSFLLSIGAEKDVLKKYLLICSLKFHSCPLMMEYE